MVACAYRNLSVKKSILFVLCWLAACGSHPLSYKDRLQQISTGLIKVRYYSNGTTDTLDRTAIPEADSLRGLVRFTQQDSIGLYYADLDKMQQVSTFHGLTEIFFQRIKSGEVFYVVRRESQDTIELGPFAHTGWAKIVAQSGRWQGQSLMVNGLRVLWSWHK